MDKINEIETERQCVESESDEIEAFAEGVLEILPPVTSEAEVPVAVTNAEQDLQPSTSDVTKCPVSQRSSGTLRYVSCKVCGKTVDHYKQERHSRTHTGIRPHVCMDCGKGFSRADILHIHERIHSGEQPYECRECGERFARTDLLSEHARLHRGELFTCSDCGKTFTRAERLRSHSLVHSGVKNLKCPRCDCCFTRADNLQTHMKLHDDESPGLDCFDEPASAVAVPRMGAGRTRQPRGPYVCRTCNRTFPLACRLRAHVRVHSGEKDFTCAVCGKQFALAYRLLLHMRIHTGEKPYQCYVCEKSFARRHNLKQHLRSHTGDKPYGCDICGKHYTQTKTLKEHMRLHTGERPFECPTCGKKFTRIDNLKVHELTHTDNKRHVCPTCGKKYADMRCFQKHVAAHEQAASGAPTSYQCGICQAVFHDLRSLQSHSRLQHRHTFQTPSADQSYYCGQCGKELTVQVSGRQEIILSANCNCSGEMDVDGTVDDVIGSDELDDVIHSVVNVAQLDNAAVKLPDELLSA